MFKYTIEYEDYNGVKRSEDAYFNISAIELLRLQNTTPGGYAEYITRIANSTDNAEIWRTFEELIRMSYGIKTDDGIHFVKVRDGHAVVDDFVDTPAYEEFMLKLMTDTDFSGEFVGKIIPQKKLEEVFGSAQLPAE